jgi:hypothetical protein
MITVIVTGYLAISLVVGIHIVRTVAVTPGEPYTDEQAKDLGYIALAAGLLWWVSVPAALIYDRSPAFRDRLHRWVER